MTSVRRRLLSLGLVVAFAGAVGGTAWAVSQNDDSPAASAEPETRNLVPTNGKLAEGSAPSGAKYVVSRIAPEELPEAPQHVFCTEIMTPAAGTQGCEQIPDEDGRVDGQPVRPSYALLGSDRFFTILAPEGVAAMEVTVKGEGKAAGSQSIDAGLAGELLMVAVGGPIVTSREPSSSRDYEVRLLGASGETISQFAMSDPPLDFAE